MYPFTQINDFLGGGYASLPFGGQVSGEALGDLIKALNVGSERDPPAVVAGGDGFAFRVEDLDPLMRVSTYDSAAIVLWKMLQKRAAQNTVVEWNETQSYGEDGFDGFMADGTLPELMESSVARRHAFVKFIGIQAAVTHGSTLVTSADGNLIAGETERKTLKLLELVERSLFYGNAGLDPVQWDGFFTQMLNAHAAGTIPDTQVKDLRGRPITLEDMEEAAGNTIAEPNFGRLTDTFVNPLGKSDMTASVLGGNRAAQGQGSTNGVIGAAFEQVNTSVGLINVHPTPFIHFGRRASATGLGDPVRRPPTPTLSVAVTTPVDPAAEFAASDAGDYSYAVVARNRYGASPPLTIGAATVAAGDQLTFGIQATPGNPTLYFEVYRSTRNGGTPSEQLIARVVNPNAAFGTVVFIDQNRDLPGTSMAISFQWEPTVVDFRQLAPFMKISLAQVDLNVRWVQCCYGTPVLYLPKKAHLFRNVGRALRAA